jgi:hypothetical protein
MDDTLLAAMALAHKQEIVRPGGQAGGFFGANLPRQRVKARETPCFLMENLCNKKNVGDVPNWQPLAFLFRYIAHFPNA